MNASELFSSFSDYLTTKDIAFASNAEDKKLTIPMEGDNGCWKTQIICEDEPTMLQVICRFPIIVAPEKLKESTILLNNINAEIRMGSFSVSHSDRNICFRISFPIESGGSLDEQFACALAAAFNPFDRYFHALAAYVCATKSTKEKLAKFAPPKDETFEDNFSSVSRVQFN